MLRRLLKYLIRTAMALVLITATIILVRAFDARRLPPLQVWHEVKFNEEYTTPSEAIQSYGDYLALEERVFDELNDKVNDNVEVSSGIYLNRYVRTSPAFPGSQSANWNKSFDVPMEKPKAGILLLHGLTDSPYSMRAIAEIFSEHGFYVLVPRMPGHGTAPAGLRQVGWEDWLSIVEFGVEHVRETIGPDAPLYVGGYSNGAALAVKYTLDSLIDETLETPKRLFLFSPMIGVTQFARFASWHRILAFLPYFEQFAWQSVYPEYDPFKYNSFPKSAGHESYRITTRVQKDFDDLEDSTALNAFPPTIVFQSLVDSTVLTSSIIDGLMERLPNEGNEIVLFDINRLNVVDTFLRDHYRVDMTALVKEERDYELTLVTNLGSDSTEVVAQTWQEGDSEGTVERLGLSWPSNTYSLSHVAIPFPPQDKLYGDGSVENGNNEMQLGNMNPRGERAVLAVPLAQLMRLRYNPLFSYQTTRILSFCPDCANDDSSDEPPE